ncbi:HAD-IIIC family phosphatase [Tumebacillus permanentifrigoris]|uniref:HAD superfamily phosphatase (TIGR01681 family)/FkbH-like protein n=1 Tax=Tumebacillus permanentifrigoris TaxID=378543 RepID=A0A316D314_9BACL|nr:HAD-IIIC family phosphatase [Tumebacillus permanentifrigoris]PWK05378.1 HAD superfamily phosphatase (TIGR01681 family)/FkbH-like protein [Tumebacillus permanentifrigoris]
MSQAKKKEKKIKCVVWDLDHTLWNGVLLEDRNVQLREGLLEIIKELDNRGILQSIASKNEHNTTMAKLEEFGIAEYFLYPHINWNSKSSSIKNIVTSLNIGMDTIAFVDDQPFEREEVSFELPDVFCWDAADVHAMLDLPEMTPTFITEDSKKRRHMYMSDIERQKVEEEFTGPQEEFLASLEMVLKISKVGSDDLQRAEELTVRTNQLNTTGYTYSYEELDALRQSDQHKLMIVELQDKYGEYGKIGLVLIECGEQDWKIKLLLMSCRVMSRGVGSILMNHILQLAHQHNVRLLAEFVKTDRNRMMYVSYKFAGFKEVEENGDHVLFEADLSRVQPFPDYVKVHVLD